MKRCCKRYAIIYFSKLITIAVFVTGFAYVNAQQTKIDSLKKLIANTKTDTTKIDLYEDLGQTYRDAKKMDSSIISYKLALEINEKYNYSKQKQLWDIGSIDYILYEMGNYSESIKYASRELELSGQLNDTAQKGFSHLVFGHDYKELGEYKQSLNHYFKAKEFFKIYWLSRKKPEDNTYTLLCISETYLKMNSLDSALRYVQQAYKIAVANSDDGLILLSTRILGDIYLAKGDDETALYYYRQYVFDYIKYKERNRDMGFVLNNMAKIFKNRNQNDSAVFYAKKALSNAREYQDQQNIYDASNLLYKLYDSKNQNQFFIANKNENIQNDNRDLFRIKIDSLKKLIASTKTDTAKIDSYEKLAQVYRDAKKMDSSILIYKRALELNERNNYSLKGQRWELACLDYMLYTTGNYAESLAYALKELAVTEKTNEKFHLGYVYLVFGHDYKELGDYRKSLTNYFKAKHFFTIYKEPNSDPQINAYTNLCIGEVFLKINQSDSSLIFTQQAYKSVLADPNYIQLYGNSVLTNYILYSIRLLGNIYQYKGEYQTALSYYRQYISGFEQHSENNRDLGFAYNNISEIFKKKGQTDSAIFYSKKALSNAEKYQDKQNTYDAANALYNLNDSLHNDSEAFKYLRIATAAKDSMASIEKIRQIQLLTFNEEVREKQQQEADAKQAAKTKRVIIIASILVSIIAFLIWNRVRQLRLRYKSILEQKESEKLKTQLFELEAKALRAQMNPHFIFNCMNSIKLLMQQNENEKAINYLTTFSKLIRTIFQNSDKREITLYDEIETCKLYTRLESMRFADKFSYTFSIDETIDLKLLMVPALIIQPFIENAIWHGIMPKEDGGCVNVIIKRKDENVLCIIDDDGIGRETSKQNKFKTDAHESKGVHLTQSRIDLDNLINQRNASLEIIDKNDEDGKSTGTSVMLKFKEI